MRASRQQCDSNVYHVIGRGTGRQIIFENDEDYEKLLFLLKQGLIYTGATLYAYCLMSNHFHLLICAPMELISKYMKWVCGQYAMYFNMKNDRVGHLFQGRFKSEPVQDEEYLLTVARYIHKNPEKAQLAKLEEYSWSSYQEYIGAPRLCDTSFILEMFGSVEAFKEFHMLDDNNECMEVDILRSKTRAMPDEHALQIVENILGPVKLSDVKAFEVPLRNRFIKDLKNQGLSVNQIERLTGIGRGVIQRVKN